jgi:hypothetical protein
MKIDTFLDWLCLIILIIGLAFIIYKSVMFYNLGFEQGYSSGFRSGFNNYLNSCQLGSIHG